MKQAVILKSYPNGIQIFLDNSLEFAKLAEQVADKFQEAASFFQDAAVAVSFEGRKLTCEEEICLVKTITDHSRLKVTCIVGKDGSQNRLYGQALGALSRMREEASCQFYRGTLRKGQLLETEAGLIILGDVQPGASVMSSGNIIVLGALLGTAYAAERGHYIAALEMAPQKLKIGDFKYQTKEEERGPLGILPQRTAEGAFHLPFCPRKSLPAKIQPQMAYVEKNRIILRPITNEYPVGLAY